MVEDTNDGDPGASANAGSGQRRDRREIPGGFPYTPTPGVLSKALARLIVSERPPQFTHDFAATVLQAKGGSGRAVLPILKRTGLVNPDGTPRDRYAQFQIDAKRPQAALGALRTGWPELFRKNRYAHRLDKAETDDLFVEITGLTRNDPIFRSISSTYQVFREYAKGADEEREPEPVDDPGLNILEPASPTVSGSHLQLGLTNQINIVLPETTDINVYHAIFKSLRESLLK